MPARFPVKKNESENSEGVEVKEEIRPMQFEPKMVLIEARKYLAAKGTKPHHIDAMIVYADSLGYRGRYTKEDWDRIFKNY